MQRNKKKSLLTLIFTAFVTVFCMAMIFSAPMEKMVAGKAQESSNQSLLDLNNELVLSAQTLTAVNGYTKDNTSTTFWESTPTVVEVDGSAGNKANVLQVKFHGWAVSRSKKGVCFTESVSVEDIDQLEIKIYANFSTQDDYYNTGLGGVRLYSLDATGAKGEGYMIPSNVQQRTWTTLTLKGDDLALIANAEGNLTGLQFGGYNNFGGGDTQNFLSNDKAYLYIESICGIKQEIKEEDGASLDTLKEKGLLLASADGYYETTDGTLQYINGLKSLAADCARWMNHNYSVQKNEGALSQNVIKYPLHSWGMVGFKTLSFKERVKVEDATGLVIRMYAHLSTSATYSTQNGGIRLYGSGQNGQLSGGYLIPSNIQQDEWIELILSQEELAMLADTEGYLSGIQVICAQQTSVKEDFHTGTSAAYIMIDYVAVSKPVTINFVSDDVQVYQMKGDAGGSLTSGYIPTKAGYVFAGWYNGDRLFNFDRVVVEDVTLTAKWVEQSDLKAKAGCYLNTKKAGKYANSGSYIYIDANGVVDFKDVSEQEPMQYALAVDDVIYTSDAKGNIVSYALGNDAYKKVTDTVKVLFDNGIATEVVYVQNNETLKNREVERVGRNFVSWQLNGVDYDFSQGVTEDLTLAVKWEYDELSDSLYNYYLGKFYDNQTGEFIILNENHQATVAGVGAEWYALTGNVIVFVTNGVETEYTLLAQRIMGADGSDYYRLGQYVITFETKGGSSIEKQMVSQETYKALKPEDPVKEGYIFKGWKLLNGTSFDFDQIIERSITLYADWEKDPNAVIWQEEVEQQQDSGCGSTIGGGIALTIVAGASVLFIAKRKKEASEDGND